MSRPGRTPLVIVLLYVALGAMACKMTPDKARKELASRDIPFTSEEFVLRCGRGQTEIVSLFLVGGASPNVEVQLDGNGFTPLMAAAAGRRLDVAAQLVEAGALPDKRSADRCALDIAAADCTKPEMVHFLLEKGARPTDLSLFVAVRHERYKPSQCGLSGLEELIAAGAPVDGRRKTDRMTPLMVAADGNDLEAVSLLLKHGANPNLRGGSYDFSPLRLAVMRAMNKGRPDSLEVVKALVAAGANVNESNQYGSVLAGLGPSPALKPIRDVLEAAGAHR